jgi:tetratricopeptide (TPR) repeat protein
VSKIVQLNRKSIGPLLKEERKKNNKSMEELADGYISAGTIGNIERGLPNVSEEKIVYYAQKLGLGKSLFGILNEAEKREKETELELNYLGDLIAVDLDIAYKTLTEKFPYLSKDNRLSPLYQFLLARCYFKMRTINKEKMLEKSETHFLRAIDFLDKNPESEPSNLRAAICNELSRISYYRHDLKKALEYTELGLSAFIPNGKGQANKYYLLSNQATYLEQLNEDERALKTLEQLFDTLSKTDGTKVLAVIRMENILQMYINFAIVLNKVKHFSKALEYADVGVSIALNNGILDKLISLWSTTGKIYENIGETDKAEQYYLKALSVKEESSETSLIEVLTNLGLLYIRKKEFAQSQELISKAVKIAEAQKDDLSVLETLVALGNCFLEQDSYQDAVRPLKKAFDLAEKYKLIKKQYEISVSLCYVYKKIKNNNDYQHYLEQMFLFESKMRWRRAE